MSQLCLRQEAFIGLAVPITHSKWTYLSHSLRHPLLCPFMPPLLPSGVSFPLSFSHVLAPALLSPWWDQDSCYTAYRVGRGGGGSNKLSKNTMFLHGPMVWQGCSLLLLMGGGRGIFFLNWAKTEVGGWGHWPCLLPSQLHMNRKWPESLLWTTSPKLWMPIQFSSTLAFLYLSALCTGMSNWDA